jgi:integrase
MAEKTIRKPYLVLRGEIWQIRDGGKLASTGERDRGEAHEALRKYVNEKQLEAARPANSATLADIISVWAEKRQSENEKTWLNKWQYIAKRLKQHSGWRSLSEIDSEWAGAYELDRYESGAQEPTVRQDLATVLAAWEIARKARPTVTSLPVPSFDLPHASESRAEFITRDEAHRLISAAEKKHVRLFIRLALATGGRHSALLELKWSRVDLEGGTIDLRTSRDNVADNERDERGRVKRAPRQKPRAFVKVEGILLDELRAARDVAVTDHVVEFAGKRIASIRNGFSSAAEAAGLDPSRVTPHVLRHTAITWLMQAGEEINRIAGLSGHKNPKMILEVYGHHHPEFQSSIAKTLSQRS